jgi:hypothetical protein
MIRRPSAFSSLFLYRSSYVNAIRKGGGPGIKGLHCMCVRRIGLSPACSHILDLCSVFIRLSVLLSIDRVHTTVFVKHPPEQNQHSDRRQREYCKEEVKYKHLSPSCMTKPSRQYPPEVRLSYMGPRECRSDSGLNLPAASLDPDRIQSLPGQS